MLPFLTGGGVDWPHTVLRRRGVKSCPKLPDTPQLLPAIQQYCLIEQRELLGGSVNKANWQHVLHSQQLEGIKEEQKGSQHGVGARGTGREQYKLG